MLTRLAVAFAAALVLSPVASVEAVACDRGKAVCSFRLFNNTAHTVTAFFASPVRSNRWEEDLLGDGVLSPGREANVNMEDGRPDCNYDFKFDFSDGDTLVKRGINVCQLGEYTLND